MLPPNVQPLEGFLYSHRQHFNSFATSQNSVWIDVKNAFSYLFDCGFNSLNHLPQIFITAPNIRLDKHF